MAASSKRIDRLFFISVLLLTGAGFVIFLSASLGLLAQSGTSFGTVALKQTISLGLGIGAFIVFARLPYTWLRKGALFIFLGAIAVNLLLFIPSFSHFHGGATRWLTIGPLSFQPSELLKIAFIIYVAAWAQYAKNRLKTMRYGIVPFIIMMGLLSILLLAQSDTDTLIVIVGTGLVMLLIAGVPMRHLLLAGCAMCILVAGVIAFRPYALQRVKTYLNGASDSQGAGYQITQSLIAVGSGQWTGRGFGQSIQKFGYLPQPTDDSIFAVAAEEFGFVGSIILVGLYLFFAATSFRIGIRSSDIFGGLLAIGISSLIITESFMNMGAMLGLLPLSGMPLLFVSHGGTALIIALAAAGIVGNVSKAAKA